MALAESIIKRIRETFGRIVPAPPAQMHPGDALLRVNISPLMGRRDAAYDRAAELLQQDVFAMGDNDRLALYRTVEEILTGAERDTTAILTMLNSPDTRNRERQMMEFMRTIRIAIGALPPLLSGARLLFDEDGDAAIFAGLTENDSALHEEQLISDCEISIVHRVRAFLDNGSVRIARYREYAGKSFSKSYAERYRKSRELHRELFLRNTQE